MKWLRWLSPSDLPRVMWGVPYRRPDVRDMLIVVASMALSMATGWGWLPAVGWAILALRMGLIPSPAHPMRGLVLAGALLMLINILLMAMLLLALLAYHHLA